MNKKYIIVALVIACLFALWTVYKSFENNSDVIDTPKMSVEQTKAPDSVKQDKLPVKISKKLRKKSPDEKYFDNYIKKSNDKFITSATKGQNNDIEFSNLMDVYEKTVSKMNDELFEKNSYDDIPVKDYKNCWVKVLPSEGSPYYELNYSYIALKYDSYISQTYKEWLNFQGKTDQLVEDAGLTVTPDKIREYIIYLENFAKNNPDFCAVDEVKGLTLIYLNFYLTGLDNTPVFDWTSNIMRPEFKSSYENFINMNSDSQYYPAVKTMYNQAEKHNFVKNQKFEHWWLNQFIPKYLR